MKKIHRYIYIIIQLQLKGNWPICGHLEICEHMNSLWTHTIHISVSYIRCTKSTQSSIQIATIYRTIVSINKMINLSMWKEGGRHKMDSSFHIFINKHGLTLQISNAASKTYCSHMIFCYFILLPDTRWFYACKSTTLNMYIYIHIP